MNNDFKDWNLWKQLAEKDLELYDIKFEFGRDRSTGEILLIEPIKK